MSTEKRGFRQSQDSGIVRQSVESLNSLGYNGKRFSRDIPGAGPSTGFGFYDQNGSSSLALGNGHGTGGSIRAASPTTTTPPSTPPPYHRPMSPNERDHGPPESPPASLRRLPRPLSRPLVLHPDFRGDGDVVLVCNDGGELVGFRVNGSMLRMASPILANLLGDKKPATPSVPQFVKVTDTPEDMHAFLRLLRFGTPSPSSSSPSSVPPAFFPTISQYDGIQRLALKYNGWYSRAVLDFHVELRAGEIADRVGQEGSKEDVYALVRLAHALHSSFLWAEICDRLRSGWWHNTLNPWKFEDDDVEAVGDSIFSLLSILASVGSREGLYSNIDELCVMYSEEGEVSVAMSERRVGQCPTCFK